MQWERRLPQGGLPLDRSRAQREKFRLPTSSRTHRLSPPPPPQEANPDTPPESAGATKVAPAPQDGLLSPAVEKRSAQLKVVGLFPAVNSFLQALERLQVFVVISDLHVNQGLQSQSGGNMAASPKEAPVVTMTLTATAYGRVNAPLASAVRP